MSNVIIDLENKDISHGVLLKKIQDNLRYDNECSFDLVNISDYSFKLIEIIIDEYRRYKRRWEALPDDIRKQVCDYLSNIGLDEIDAGLNQPEKQEVK